MCLGILNITNDVLLFFNSMPSFWDFTHCPFREKGSVTFLNLPVYKLLHCNLLSEVVVVVRCYSSTPSSCWFRVYFQSGWFPPWMCIENESWSVTLTSLCHLDLCSCILMSRLAWDPAAWQAPSGTRGFRQPVLFEWEAQVLCSGPLCRLPSWWPFPRCPSPRDNSARTPVWILLCRLPAAGDLCCSSTHLLSLFPLILCRCWDGWRRSPFAVELREAWSTIHPLLTFEVVW